MNSVGIAPQALREQLINNPHPHKALVVDVRGRRQFHHARIPGTHNIPAARLVSGEHHGQDLILIATEAGEAEAIAESLHQAGFHRRIQHLEGGLIAWEKAGLDLETEADGGGKRPAAWAQRRPWVLSLGVLGLGLAAQQADPALLIRACGLWFLLGALGLSLHRATQQLLRRSV